MFENIELTYLFLVGIFSYYLMKTVFLEKMPMYYIKLPIYIITTIIFSLYYFNNPITYLNTSIYSFLIMSVISQITVYRGYNWRISTGFGLGFVYLFFIFSSILERGLAFQEIHIFIIIIGTIIIISSTYNNSKLEKLYMSILFIWASTAFLQDNNILKLSFIIYAFSEMILLLHMKMKESINPELRKKEKYLINHQGERVVDLYDWEKILNNNSDFYVNKRGAYKKQLIHDYLATGISVVAHIYLSLYYVV
jgi:hypothetical protein